VKGEKGMQGKSEKDQEIGETEAANRRLAYLLYNGFARVRGKRAKAKRERKK